MFEEDGYLLIEDLLSDADCDELVTRRPIIESSGSRKLLEQEPYRRLVASIRAHTDLSTLLAGLVAVECILFHKSSAHNWGVQLHRDVILPMNGDGPWTPAGTKEGLHCVRPPRSFMDQCVAVRVHLDGAMDEDVSVISGSHLSSFDYDRSIARPLPVPRGGALVLRPTLAHASSKLPQNRVRRVLHYVFAPATLPQDYTWYYAA